ncbi:hypothetical protein E2C01_003641 [Portunus trituberculatus]|uniref:Uncharacterized protein n=1 Tax=Portunus trituberculatus TaxID=210409 RepID=A0A5B7CN95_PORTR|nr:hypothetical protein [Portunus trituberculatus]
MYRDQHQVAVFIEVCDQYPLCIMLGTELNGCVQSYFFITRRLHQEHCCLHTREQFRVNSPPALIKTSCLRDLV